MKKTVFVLLGHEYYEDTWIVAIYASEKAAMKALKEEEIKDPHVSEYNIEEWIVLK